MEISVNEKYNIKAQIIYAGKDLCVIIYGGDEPHIGAISCCIYANADDSAAATSEEHGDEIKAEYFNTLIFPSHEEAALSKPLALNLSKKLKRKVVVLCGIHVDGISKAEIEEIIGLIPEMEDIILNAINHGK